MDLTFFRPPVGRPLPCFTYVPPAAAAYRIEAYVATLAGTGTAATHSSKLRKIVARLMRSVITGRSCRTVSRPNPARERNPFPFSLFILLFAQNHLFAVNTDGHGVRKCA